VISSVSRSYQSEWGGPPLCSRYFTAFVFDVLVQVREWAGTKQVQMVRCSLGLLEDGECEILGTWLAPTSSQTLSQTVLEDLKFRGVEKVRFFVFHDPAGLRADACVAYPESTVLPLVSHLLCQSLALVAPRHRGLVAKALRDVGAAGSAEAAHDALSELAAGPLGATYPAVVESCAACLEMLGPLYALAPRQRRVLLRGDDITQELHQSLNRAVARHGIFADREAAMSFVAQALRRAERRLDARGMDRAAAAKASVVRPGTRSEIQSLAF